MKNKKATKLFCGSWIVGDMALWGRGGNQSPYIISFRDR